MSSKIKIAIFDLDGTLINSIGDISSSLNEALEDNSFPKHNVERILTFIGDGVEELVERALPVEVRDDKTICNEVLNGFKSAYKKNGTSKTVIYDGIKELLKELDNKGVMCAVASNKYQSGTEEVVDHYFSDINFCMIEGKRDNRATKPNPQIVLDIIKECNIKKEEVLYIGDSDVDMQTSVNAGVCGVGVTWGYRSKKVLLDSGAKYIVENPNEILALI